MLKISLYDAVACEQIYCRLTSSSFRFVGTFLLDQCGTICSNICIETVSVQSDMMDYRTIQDEIQNQMIFILLLVLIQALFLDPF